MFEDVPQELKDAASNALRDASSALYKLLSEAENVVDAIDVQLDKWREALTTEPDTGGSEELSPEQKYQYIVDHTSNQVLKEVYKGAVVKEYLLSDPEALDRLYVQIHTDEMLKTDNWNH